MQSSFRSRNEKQSRSKPVDDVNSWSPNGIAWTTTRHQGSILPDELHPHTACGWQLFFGATCGAVLDVAKRVPNSPHISGRSCG